MIYLSFYLSSIYLSSIYLSSISILGRWAQVLVPRPSPPPHCFNLQNIWSFIHVIVHIGVAARAGAPLRRAPGRRRGEAPTREGASGAGGGCVGWRARVRSGGSPLAGAVGLEFPSKGIRREFCSSLRRDFEGNYPRNSKGDGTLVRVVSGTSCNHFLALPRTVARSLRRNSKKNRRRQAMWRRDKQRREVANRACNS